MTKTASRLSGIAAIITISKDETGVAGPKSILQASYRSGSAFPFIITSQGFVFSNQLLDCSFYGFRPYLFPEEFVLDAI